MFLPEISFYLAKMANSLGVGLSKPSPRETVYIPEFLVILVCDPSTKDHEAGGLKLSVQPGLLIRYCLKHSAEVCWR